MAAVAGAARNSEGGAAGGVTVDSGGRRGVGAMREVCILDEVRSKNVYDHGSQVG